MKKRIIPFILAIIFTSALIYGAELSHNHTPIVHTSINELKPETDRSSLLKKFANNRAEMIAFFAHPTSTYVSSSSYVSGNTVYLTIKMKDGWFGDINYMELAIVVNYNNFIGSIKVLRDDDSFPAFLSLSIIKSLIDEEIRGSGDDDASRAEEIVAEILNRSYYQWNGQDLCLFFLNFQWLDNGYYSEY